MIRKTSKLLMEITGAILAGLMIAAVLLGLRLAAGPISLNAMNGLIAASISMPDKGVHFSVEETEMAWDAAHTSVVLRALSLRAFDTSGQMVAILPDLSVGISLRGLLFGHIAPSSIALIEPSLVLIRYEDGRIGFDAENTGSEDKDGTDAFLTELLAAVSGEGRGGLAYLDRVEVQNADLLFDDRKNGANWWIPKTNLILERTRKGLFGTADIRVELNEQTTQLHAELRSPKNSKEISVVSSFTNIDFTNVVSLLPELREIGILRLPVSGEVKFTLSDNWQVRGVTVRAEGGEGFVTKPDLFAERLRVKHLLLDLQYAGEDALQLNAFNADFEDGTKFSAKGKAEKTADGYSAQIRADIADLDMKNLNKYWPLGAAQNARDWVVPNVQAGHVSKAFADLSGAWKAEDMSDFTVRDLKGEIHFTGATADYFNPLPKAEGIDGMASFDRDKFTLSTQGGHVQNITMGKADIVINGLTAVDQDIDIHVETSGGLGEALAIADMKPLQLPGKRGIKPADIRGNFNAGMHFAFPLLKDLKLEQLKINIEGKLQKVYYHNAFRALPLSRGEMSMKLTESAMEVAGNAYLGGLAADIMWSEDFRDKPEKFRSRYLVKADFPALGAEIFALPMPLPISGRADMDVDYTVQDGAVSRLVMRADLENTSIAIPEANWWKEPGQPATAHLEMNFEKEELRAIPTLTLKGKDTLIQGNAAFAADGELSKLTLPVMRTPQNDARVDLLRAANGDYTVSVNGRKFDAAHLNRAHKKNSEEEGNYAIDLDLDALSLGGKSDLHDVDARLALRRGEFESLRLTAASVGENDSYVPVEISILPETGGRKLSIRTEDAGGFLRAADLYDNMYGGKLEMSGLYSGPQKPQPLTARLNIYNFRVQKAPVLAKLLNLSSLTGILDNMSGQGIFFDKMAVDIKLKEDMVEVENGRINGSSIGLKASGKLDLAAQRYDLEGILIPANNINKIISDIPLIGSILTAGGDQPLLAFNYRIKGALADPKVSVNPLSALTPGILREIFDGGGNKN